MLNNLQIVRVALVEDQHLFRQSLAALINTTNNIELVAAVADGETLLSQLTTAVLLPDIVIVDMNLPGLTGIELHELMHKKYPTIKTIILSVYNNERLISKMINAGACAYLNKNCDANELITAIKTVAQTGFYINKNTLQAMQKAAGLRNKTIKNLDAVNINLTNREKEILVLICKEYSNTEIAEKLFLSIRTVEGHRNNLLLKTGCRNSAGLVLFAIKNGLWEVMF